MVHRFLLVLFCLFATQSSFACRCEDHSIGKEFKSSEVVVLARVIDVTEIELCETMEQQSLLSFEESLDKWGADLLSTYRVLKVEAQVVRKYKGAEVDEKITIYTAASGNACGFSSFEKNRSYLIYADDQSYLFQMVSPNYKKEKNLEKRGTFWTSHCKRTTANFVEEVRELETIF